MIFYCQDHPDQVVDSYKYSITVDGSYVNKSSGNRIVCPECGKGMSPTEVKGEFNVSYGRTSSMSREDKKKMLKKRSKAHNKKHRDDRISMAMQNR